jgi:hypothetical protein
VIAPQALSGGILIYVALVHMIRGYAELDIKGMAAHYHKYLLILLLPVYIESTGLTSLVGGCSGIAG